MLTAGSQRHANVLLGISLIALLLCGCFGSKQGSGTQGGDSVTAQQISREAPNETSEIPTPIFNDVASEAGIRFVYQNGQEANHFAILESLGGGVAALDYDRDGLEDLCFSGGGAYEPDRKIMGHPCGLFRNRGEWRFDTVSEAAGVTTARHYSHGVIRGDYNSDGFADFLVTGYGGLELFLNLGDGTFAEVAEVCGFTDSNWSSSAAWGDLNKDGHLDLFVVHYVNWSFENDPPCAGPGEHKREVCPPRQFTGLQDTVYLSNGDGSFHDATTEAGVLPEGKGLSVVVADLDSDSDLDVYVTNDTVANHLYTNNGHGVFEDMSLMSGTSLSDRGIPDGSMGVDLFDFNQDGRLDLWVVNYENESAALYQNEGNMFFRHVSQPTGVTAVGGLFVGWGTCCLDYDHDGDEDMFVSNGHVVRFPVNAPVRQKPLLFENLGRSRFRNAAETASGYLAEPHPGRGAAAADFDNDGKVDLAISHVNEPVALLANRTESPGAWLSLDLIGTVSPRDPIGATVKVWTASGAQTLQRIGGGSYASSESGRLAFGLGNVEKIDAVEITWPSGLTQKLSDVALNTHLTITEQRNGS